jgi:hypothetical protein
MLTGLPDPPPEFALGWCGVCVGAYKHGLTDDKTVAGKIKTALGDGRADQTMPVGKPLGKTYGPLQAAVCTAPAIQIPGAPVMGLCWTHAPSIPPGPAANGKRVHPAGAIEGLRKGKG